MKYYILYYDKFGCIARKNAKLYIQRFYYKNSCFQFSYPKACYINFLKYGKLNNTKSYAYYEYEHYKPTRKEFYLNNEYINDFYINKKSAWRKHCKLLAFQ